MLKNKTKHVNKSEGHTTPPTVKVFKVGNKKQIVTAAKGKLHLAYNETVIQLTCQSKMMETRRMDIFKLMKKNKKMSAPHSNFSDNINHD